MQWQPPYTQPNGAGPTKPCAIVRPDDGQGVGNALRSAYLPRISDMPLDMADLLDQLI